MIGGLGDKSQQPAIALINETRVFGGIWRQLAELFYLNYA